MTRDGATDWGAIRVRGARENNLQNVDLDVPKRKLTVFTGVSGSGKSSLVFDTIAAESPRSSSTGSGAGTSSRSWRCRSRRRRLSSHRAMRSSGLRRRRASEPVQG